MPCRINRYALEWAELRVPHYQGRWKNHHGGKGYSNTRGPYSREWIRRSAGDEVLGVQFRGLASRGTTVLQQVMRLRGLGV